MKIHFILTLLFSMSIEAKTLATLENEELFQIHPKGKEGVIAFIKANGFLYQAQQQQQQPQRPSCNLQKISHGSWTYSENYNSNMVRSYGEYISRRSKIEGFSYRFDSLDAFSTALSKLEDKQFKLRCFLESHSQVNSAYGGQVYSYYTDQDCLNKCRENEVERCEQYCIRGSGYSAPVCPPVQNPGPFWKIKCSLETLN